MRIKTFCKLIEVHETENHVLQNCQVVFDGQNYFYDLYKQNELPYALGCESDRYANILRKHLSMFKKANVKCYFIFKGGHKDIKNKQQHRTSNKYNPADYVAGSTDYTKAYVPIFAKEVYKQVLDEMEFDYTFCQYESKRECIALAQKLECAVISFDIEFCFSGIPYIPHNSLIFNESRNTIYCQLFKFDKFLKNNSMTEDKLATFIVLTDQKIFPEDIFLRFRKHLKLPLGHFKRNLCLLQWLSRNTTSRALETVFKFISCDDKNIFLEKEKEMRAMMRRQEVCGLPSQYFENGNKLKIAQNDPLWFEKGIACKHVAIPYANLYRSDFLMGSTAIEDTDAEDAIMLSIDIIKYAYNLLTNYQNTEFNLYDKHETLRTIELGNETTHEDDGVVFRSGWDEVRLLGLFERFLKEALKDIDLEKLEEIPEDARLLMIALIYFSRMKPIDTLNEAYSVILSYVMLGVVCEKSGIIELKDTPEDKLDATICNVTKSDCDVAADRLAKYFELSDDELKVIFDRKLLHPLVEYQYCLLYMNFLNKLCGSPYKPTIYSKSYNGTFVYKVLYGLKRHPGGDGETFLTDILKPAATVLSFVNDLIKLYEDMTY